MMRQSMVAIALALVAGASFAQAPVSISVRDVKGLVTVSNGSSIVNVSPGSQYTDGSHFVTGAGSGATLRLSNGCELKMDPNQAITVDSRRSCDQLLALLRSPNPTAALATGTSSPAFSVALFAGGLVAANAATGRSRAGAGGGGVIPTPPGGGGDIPTPPGGGGGGNIPNPPVSTQ